MMDAENYERVINMQKQKTAERKYAIIAAVLMAVAFLLREIYEDLPNAMLQSVMCLIRDTIHISLLFSLGGIRAAETGQQECPAADADGGMSAPVLAR